MKPEDKAVVQQVRKYLVPGAIVPVDVPTTQLLLRVLRQLLEQPEPVAWHDKIMGMEVSMDVSTGDDDIDHRVYGTVYEVIFQDDGGTPDVILAIETERNFTTPPAQPAPVQEPEPACWQGDDCCPNRNACCDAQHCLYTTPPAQPAPVQEPWSPNDTANRIGGLPQDFIRHEVENEGDWSEWVSPNPEQYFMKCCDCGLVHEMQFKVAKYSDGDDCEFIDDPNLQPVFRARRATPPAQPADLNLNCKSVQARLATQWGYVKAEPDEWPTGCPECGMDSGCDCDSGTWNPPAQPDDHGDELTIAYLDGVHTGKQLAKREWVGLTDEEIKAACAPLGFAQLSPIEVARAIEAKLREKNGGGT
jgi:hypothetical protein